MMLRLEIFEQQLDAGTLSDFSQKIYGALSNHVRLGLREIGVKPRSAAPPTPMSLATKMALKASRP